MYDMYVCMLRVHVYMIVINVCVYDFSFVCVYASYATNVVYFMFACNACTLCM